MIQFRYIPSQFSSEGRESWTEVSTDQSLADALPERFKTEYKVIHSRHGRVREPEWATTILKNGDEVVIVPDVGLFAAVLWFMGAAWQTAVGMALSEAAMYYSFYQQRRAKKAAKASRGSGSMQSSPTFGWDGIHTTASSNIPVPVAYGTHDLGGNFINTFVFSRGNVNYLCVLIALSEGPVHSIAGIETNVNHVDSDDARIGDKIKINGNPIGNYPNIWVSTRLGTETQSVIPGHTESVDGYPDGLVFPGFELTHNINSYTGEQIVFTRQTSMFGPSGTNVHTTAEGVDVDSVWIGIRFPALYNTETGGIYGNGAQFKIEYKLHDSETWLVETLAWTVKGKTTTTLRRQYGFVFTHNGRSEELGGIPTPGRYDVRITKITKDSTEDKASDAYWDYMDEITHKRRRYPYTALLGLTIPATDQLSGGLPNIVTEVKGRKISAPDFKIGAAEQDWEDVYWNTTNSEYRMITGDASVTSSGFRDQYCANPIWIVYDLLLHTRYGVGGHVVAANMNLSEFHVTSRYCDTLVDEFDGDTTDTDWRRRFRFDGPIDEIQKAFDALELVLNTVAGNLIWSGGYITPFIDRTTDSTQMLTMGSIKEGTFKETFLPKRAAPNANELQFLDKANGYTRETIVVRDATALANDDPINKRVIYMPGVTRRSQIIRFGIYLTNLYRLTTRSLTLEAGVEAVGCNVGDVIDIGHDQPEWGQSGRVTDGTANSIYVNREIVLDVGHTYYVQVRHNVDDSIEEQEIASAAGTYAIGAEISITDAFDTTPADYDTFSIGKQNIVTKPYRALKMARTNATEVGFDFVEYNEEIYSDDGAAVDPPPYSDLPIISAIPEHVEDLTAVNSIEFGSAIYISWTIADATAEYGLYSHAKVWINPTGLPPEGTVVDPDWIDAGDTGLTYYTIQNLVPGITYGISVIAYGINGIHAPWDTAPFAEVTVTSADPPGVIRGLEIKDQGNDTEFVGKDAVFSWWEASVASGWDISDMINIGIGSGWHDTYFKDYRIEIWDTVAGTYGKLREEVGILRPEYIYTYEKNLADLSNVPNRSFEIKVWARDIYNRQSEYPAVLSVSNPVAAMPTGFGATATGRDIALTWNENPERDISGYVLKRSKTPGFLWADGDIVYEGKNTSFFDLRAEADPPITTYYYRLGSYDSFGQDNMLYTSVINATTAYIPPNDIGWATPIPIDPNFNWNPVGSRVTWDAHTLYYSGTSYPITAGDILGTAGGVLTWTVGDSTYTSNVGIPSTPDKDRYPIAITHGATYGVEPAWNKIANEGIYGPQIADTTIDKDKIVLATLTGDQINPNNSIDYNHLSVGGIYVRDIGVKETLHDFEEDSPSMDAWIGPDYTNPSIPRELELGPQRTYYTVYVDHATSCGGSHDEIFKARIRLVRVTYTPTTLTQFWISDWENFTLTAANKGTTITIFDDLTLWPIEQGLDVGESFIFQIMFSAVTSGVTLASHSVSGDPTAGGFESAINSITSSYLGSPDEPL